jgi:hypothetical protein
MSALLPDYTTPNALADHLGVSRRFVRELVRSLGSYSLFGKTVILFDNDVGELLEATRPCHLKSTGAAKSGTTGELLPVGDYADLQARRIKQSPDVSRRRPKTARGEVISMAPGRT